MKGDVFWFSLQCDSCWLLSPKYCKWLVWTIKREKKTVRCLFFLNKNLKLIPRLWMHFPGLDQQPACFWAPPWAFVLFSSTWPSDIRPHPAVTHFLNDIMHVLTIYSLVFIRCPSFIKLRIQSWFWPVFYTQLWGCWDVHFLMNSGATPEWNHLLSISFVSLVYSSVSFPVYRLLPESRSAPTNVAKRLFKLIGGVLNIRLQAVGQV